MRDLRDELERLQAELAETKRALARAERDAIEAKEQRDRLSSDNASLEKAVENLETDVWKGASGPLHKPAAATLSSKLPWFVYGAIIAGGLAYAFFRHW